MDPKLIGVWQNKKDDNESWTVKANGRLTWSYRGVAEIGIADAVVEYMYSVDLTKSPAHLDLIHLGVMGTSHVIYAVIGDELRVGIAPESVTRGERPRAFGARDRFYRRVK